MQRLTWPFFMDNTACTQTAETWIRDSDVLSSLTFGAFPVGGGRAITDLSVMKMKAICQALCASQPTNQPVSRRPLGILLQEVVCVRSFCFFCSEGNPLLTLSNPKHFNPIRHQYVLLAQMFNLPKRLWCIFKDGFCADAQSCRHATTRCSKITQNHPLVRLSLSFVWQFLGLAFLAIGLWAWSEKVSGLCGSRRLLLSCIQTSFSGFPEAERNVAPSTATPLWTMRTGEELRRWSEGASARHSCPDVFIFQKKLGPSVNTIKFMQKMMTQ